MIVRDSGPHVRHIERLEDELEAARDRIKELEQALGIGDDITPLVRTFSLTPAEARIVNLLLRQQTATREQMLLAVYVDDPDRRYDVSPKTVDKHLSCARAKLKRFGVQITDGRRQGWLGVSVEPKARLRALAAGVESRAMNGG